MCAEFLFGRAPFGPSGRVALGAQIGRALIGGGTRWQRQAQPDTLRAGTDTIADVFAGRTRVTMAERFNTGSWGELSTGAPVLNDAVVACDCRVIEIKSVATHNVVFAGVVAVRLGTPGPALVYHERAYKQV